MQEQRKLAAIMFTDIVGYTALMSKDEQHAHQIIKKSRDFLKALIEQFNGECLQAVGDGTLSSFASVVDAVNCALEIQRTLKSDPAFSLRIGIHIGDVVFEEGEIYGDGVNVASRLESLADAGGICISGRVYGEVRNKPGIEAEFLGEKTLKNVDFPMKVYALAVKGPPAAVPESPVDKKTEPAPVKRSSRRILIAVAGIIVVILGLYAVYSRYLAVPTTVPGEKVIKSIAVLPFVNMSAEKDQEYFCDGMAEELINSFAKIEGLRVIARTSSFSFKGKEADIRTIGQKLDVEAVLEGSVRKADNRVRITAQLINVSDRSHLWSETYDRRLDDIFAVQEEISQAVVGALEVMLLGESRARLAKKPTENIEAYELYLLGRHYYQKLSVESLEKAIRYFSQAIELDSNYALAYTGLADSYVAQARWGNLPRSECLPGAEAAAGKALALDDQLAEAYTSLGGIKQEQFDGPGAMSAFQRAIELNPNHLPAYRGYSRSLQILGRPKEANSLLEQALVLDPLAPELIESLGYTFQKMGRFEEALAQYQKAIEILPDNWGLYDMIAGLKLMTGNFLEALRWSKKCLTLDPNNAESMANIGNRYLVLGDYQTAGQWFERAVELAPERGYILAQKSSLWLARGQYDEYLKFSYDRLKKFPNSTGRLAEAGFAEMLAGNYAKARTLYERADSAYTQTDFPFGLSPWDIANGRSQRVNMANVYIKTSDPQLAEDLLRESLDFLEMLREQGLATSGSYYVEASIYALQGNKRDALISLRKAIDIGWRELWYAKQDPNLEPLRDTPEFKEMMAEVEADIARQRRQLEEEGLLE